MTAAIQSRLRSATTATTPSRCQPARQQGPAQPVGPGVELPVGPPPAGVLRRDGVRVRGDPLLEQLVEPVVGQLAPRPGQPVELEPELLGREQALPAVLGVRVGGQLRSAVRW